MQGRHEIISMQHIRRRLRMLHISDVHFSKATGHQKNADTIRKLLDLCDRFDAVDVICITGDLVSRNCTPESFQDAAALLCALSKRAARLYLSLGNHEMDHAPDVRRKFLDSVPGIVLDNASDTFEGVQFSGITLPRSVYKNEQGGYSKLSTITLGMVENCIGASPDTPCVLLAHTPLGLDAYAAWGADLVLSGHVHGGIVRLGNIGFLSPERRFFPRYTKGIYRKDDCIMHVSAGIGKFRLCNPAEVVCIDLVPKEGM